MDELSLQLLGPPVVQQAGMPVKFATRKVQALLLYLAVERGWHGREQLMALLWPESDPALARAALRNTLTRLRAALNADTLVQSDGDRVGIPASATLTSDLATLQALLRQPTFDLPTARHALTHWRGEFLAGFSLDDAPEFESWVSLQREYWHQQVSLLFDRCCQRQAEEGDVTGALTTALRWLGQDRLNEAIYGRLMELYLAAGDREAALRIYQDGREMLAREVGLPVSAELEVLAREARGERHAAQAAQPLTPPASPHRRTGLLDLPLLGRSAEWEQLLVAFATGRAGRVQVMVIEGEAGMGKSHVAEGFLAWAATQKAEILRGRAFETGGRLPYQPISEALQQRLAAENAPDDLLSDLWLAELSRLLPDLRDRYPDLPLPLASGDDAAQSRLFEAVARLGQALAARAPLVCLIDDLQWADPSSLDLLHFMARRWAQSQPPSPILLLFTIRSEALIPPSSWPAWLEQLRRDLPVQRITLGTLSQPAIDQLVGWLTGAEISTPPLTHFSQWLLAETQGHPLFIVETLKALLEQKRLTFRPTVGGRWVIDLATLPTFPQRSPAQSIPSGVRQTIAQRLARLTPDATALVGAAAVLGQRLSFERLIAVAGIEELAGLRAVDELLATRVLLEQPANGAGDEQGYRFAPDKIRAVVYEAAGAARRRVFHRRAFAVLQQSNGSPAELGHHARAAGLLQPAFHYSRLAGDEALRLFALRAALEHYQQAQALAAELPLSDPEHLAALTQLYLQQGRAYELINERAAARALYQTLRELAQQQHLPVAECAALNRLATLLAAQNTATAQAELLLQQARQLAEAHHDAVGLAETVWNLAQIRVYLASPDDIAYSQQALALARAAESPALIARSLNALAHAYQNRGRWAEIIGPAEEARQLYRQLGDRAMEAEQETLLALQYNNLGQIAASLAAGRRAMAITRQIENQWGEAFAAFALSLTLVDCGEVGEALQLAQRGVDLVQPLQVPPLEIVNRVALGRAQIAAGQLDAAHTTLHTAQTLNDASGAMQGNTELIANYRCYAYALQGDWANAYTFARQAIAARDYAGSLSAGMQRWCEIEAFLRHGDVELARQELAEAAAQVERSPRLRLAWLQARASLARWEGQGTEAQKLNQAALHLAEQLGLPAEQRYLRQHGD